MTRILPGERLPYGEECIAGHGVYIGEDKQGNPIAIASVQGKVQQIDRLLRIESDSPWYTPYIGDLVIGRITAIANKRWYVDINAKLETVLMLTAINLESNVQRRKGELDEILMSTYYPIGSVIIAEVQSIGNKIQLHTRNKNYKKVPNGFLIKHPANILLFSILPLDTTTSQTTDTNTQVTIAIGKNNWIAIYGPPNTTEQIEITVNNLIESYRIQPLEKIITLETCNLSEITEPLEYTTDLTYYSYGHLRKPYKSLTSLLDKYSRLLPN
ncbi:exosome complex component RRP4 [Nematocida sp. AWRm80]|nr:exosome complex component RRP4 [Nematocida sp. AWRm80]